jgi:periplasmic divalent cation tolerance protein
MTTQTTELSPSAERSEAGPERGVERSETIGGPARGGDTSVVVALSTLPPTQAESIAEVLVGERLAACVNLVAPVRSIYRWDGAIQKDAEILAVIKTTAARVDALAARLREIHPYQVPELIVLPVERGLPAYLDWVRAEAAAAE